MGRWHFLVKLTYLFMQYWVSLTLCNRQICDRYGKLAFPGHTHLLVFFSSFAIDRFVIDMGISNSLICLCNIMFRSSFAIYRIVIGMGMWRTLVILTCLCNNVSLSSYSIDRFVIDMGRWHFLVILTYMFMQECGSSTLCNRRTCLCNNVFL